jgi:hypothetical protein
MVIRASRKRIMKKIIEKIKLKLKYKSTTWVKPYFEDCL